ncbi:MAG: hypothetical protein ACRD2X_26655 [Vicinamibacteraceae bacterium]
MLALTCVLVGCSASDIDTGPPATEARPAPGVRVSAWYWLNSAPKNEWARDFKNMRQLGFTHVVVGWGLNSSAGVLRVADTRDAMRWAHDAALGAYIIVWHPTHNHLERRPEYQQVSVSGKHLFTFDPFNAEWRASQWKEYLQALARAYKDEPAMAGYLFDDSFMTGPIDTVSGKGLGPDEDIVSYNNWEKKAFGEPLPTSATDPRRKEWVEARATWWEDWAADTVGFIRAVDPDREHEIYLEDLDYILDPVHREKKGLDFARVAKHFDAVGAYTMAEYDDTPGSTDRAVGRTRRAIVKLREIVGADKKIIYTFWIANPKEEFQDGPAKYPTVPQIRRIAEAALAEGITHLDMYGYRIGDFRVTDENWMEKRPNDGPTFPITGQFPQKFLWDRPQLHEEFGKYFKGLNES